MRLIRDQPWYGNLILLCDFKLLAVPNNKDGTPGLTACVDTNCNFIINPVFFDPLPGKVKEDILIHELLHIVWDHPKTMAEKDNADRYNIAADLCVNSYCPNIPKYNFSPEDKARIQKGEPVSNKAKKELAEGFYGQFPEYFGFKDGLLDLEYYDLLPKNDQQLKKMIAATSINGGKAPQHRWKPDKHKLDRLQRIIEGKLEEMEATGHRRGECPAGLKKLLGDIEKKRRIPWNQILRPMVKRILSGIRRMTFRRPDRRFGVFPGRHREKKQNIVLAIDTSGSTIFAREEFAAEMVSIHAQTKAKMLVIECDAAVDPDGVYEFTGKPPTRMTGGGGTSFGPVFKYIRDKKIACDILIYLTDGYGEHPNKPDYVNYPTIWVTTDAEPASFGKIIKMNLEHKDRW